MLRRAASASARAARARGGGGGGVVVGGRGVDRRGGRYRQRLGGADGGVGDAGHGRQRALGVVDDGRGAGELVVEQRQLQAESIAVVAGDVAGGGARGHGVGQRGQLGAGRLQRRQLGLVAGAADVGVGGVVQHRQRRGGALVSVGLGDRARGGERAAPAGEVERERDREAGLALVQAGRALVGEREARVGSDVGGGDLGQRDLAEGAEGDEPRGTGAHLREEGGA
ncbi:MAG: hypothetical protein R2939_08480 [Kofleriaceae bacterium]